MKWSTLHHPFLYSTSHSSLTTTPSLKTGWWTKSFNYLLIFNVYHKSLQMFINGNVHFIYGIMFQLTWELSAAMFTFLLSIYYKRAINYVQYIMYLRNVRLTLAESLYLRITYHISELVLTSHSYPFSRCRTPKFKISIKTFLNSCTLYCLFNSKEDRSS